MKHRYRYGLKAIVSTATLLSVSMGACGQDQPEEIIVTGSYIRGTPTDAASPVDVISRADFVAQGAVLPSDVIANLNSNSGSTTNLDAAQENNNIAGKGNVNLRNLGLNSTLVLINGKRQTVAAARTQRGETFVDINEIPAVMLERIEVLKNGASATYGSDAIAGVANFITRENFQGMEFSTQYLRTGNSNQDDMTFGGVYGWSSADDRTQLVIGADYLMRSDLPVNDKNLQTREDNGTIFGSRILQDLTPTSGTRNPAFTRLPGGADFKDAGCEANGGFSGNFPNDALRAECRFDSRRYQVYVPETDRLNSMLHLSHKFNERAKLYSEILYSQTDLKIPTANALSPTGVNYLQLPANNGDANLGNLALGSIRPDGSVRLLSERPTILNAPISLANGGFNSLNRMDFSIGTYGEPESSENDSQTQRYLVGLKGDLPLAGREVGYDVSLGYSRNKSVTHADSLNKDRMELAVNGLGGPNCVPNGVANLPLLEELTTLRPIFAGQFLNLAAPLDPEFASNNRGIISLAVSSTNQGQGGCQFFNPYLSALDGTGPANDPALLEYIRIRNEKINDSMTELRVVDAVFTADLFDLAGGSVGAAFGLQYREDRRTSEQVPQRFGSSLITSVNPTTLVPTLRPVTNDAIYGTSTNDFDASQDVKAVFLEFQLPITRDLEVQLASRYEDVGLNVDFTPQSLSFRGALDNVDGSLGNELTSKIAVRWQALDQVAVRASFGQSFRVPNLGLLFEGSGYDGGATVDPLATQAVRNGSRNPLDAYTDPVLMAQSRRGFLRLGLPSPELQPEKADSYDLGLIFTPLAGLNVTLDYYRVDFRDAIVPTPFADILGRQVALFNQVVNDPSTRFVIDNTNMPCAKGSAVNCVVDPQAFFIPAPVSGGGFAPIERIFANLAIVRVNDINAGKIETDGLELDATYTFNALDGKFILGTDWTFVNKYEVEVGGVKFDAAGRTNDDVPIRSMPDLRGNLNATYVRGNQNITAVARHIGEYSDDFNDDTISSYTTFDLSYGYALKWSSSMDPVNLRLGIIDVTDEDIPRREGFSRGYDTTVFSPNGRRFFLQFNQSF